MGLIKLSKLLAPSSQSVFYTPQILGGGIDSQSNGPFLVKPPEPLPQSLTVSPGRALALVPLAPSASQQPQSHKQGAGRSVPTPHSQSPITPHLPHRQARCRRSLCIRATYNLDKPTATAWAPLTRQTSQSTAQRRASQGCVRRRRVSLDIERKAKLRPLSLGPWWHAPA